MECAGPASVVFDQTLTQYDFGPTHPMSPVRVDLTMRLADELGVLAGIKRVDAPVATDEQIATVHDQGLIEAVTRAGATPGFEDAARGLGTEDDPVFSDMHLASAHVVGATLEA
ncbi:MAG TPA: acetoin utilization protein AcuC, partial [Nocardioides sp.]|nr:acetoin utilization protein AcuC [Nocardioides sp.]